MQLHEFNAQFANLPIEHRFKILNFAKYGTMTMYQLYQRVQELERQMYPQKSEQAKLLFEANEFFRLLNKEEK